MILLHRLAAWLGLTARGTRARVAVVEECEARILYSADLNPALWAGQADPAQPSAIVGVLDPQAAATALQATAGDRQQSTQRSHEIVFVDAAVTDLLL